MAAVKTTAAGGSPLGPRQHTAVPAGRVEYDPAMLRSPYVRVDISTAPCRGPLEASLLTRPRTSWPVPVHLLSHHVPLCLRLSVCLCLFLSLSRARAFVIACACVCVAGSACDD